MCTRRSTTQCPCTPKTPLRAVFATRLDVDSTGAVRALIRALRLCIAAERHTDRGREARNPKTAHRERHFVQSSLHALRQMARALRLCTCIAAPERLRPTEARKVSALASLSKVRVRAQVWFETTQCPCTPRTPLRAVFATRLDVDSTGAVRAKHAR